MLRIISGLLLLIISQFTFASVSTTTETIPATATAQVISSNTDFSSYCASKVDSSTSNFTYSFSRGSTDGVYIYCWQNSIRLSDGYTSESSVGSIKISTLPIIYSCPSGYILSGTNCNKENSIDSCATFAGQSGYFWVNKVNPPSNICSGTCLASAVAVAGFPDADPLSWQYLQYTYTGATSGCSADSGFTDDATAAADNTAAVERERLAKIQKAIDDAITACGGTGHYTTGTFNGNTVITCKDSTAQNTANNSTTTSTTNNNDGSTTTTTTTTTNNSTTTNNNTSTTVNSDGSTTTTGGSSSGSSSGSGGGTSGGSTAGTSGTTTTTTTTNPDGSTTSTTSSASSTTLPGTAADYDYKDTNRNDWSSKNFQSVIESNIEKLKGTALYGSITGFFTVSFNGSCSASDFNTSYQGAELSASFDWCTSLSPYQIYIKAIVLFLCSFYAFRRAIE